MEEFKDEAQRSRRNRPVPSMIPYFGRGYRHLHCIAFGIVFLHGTGDAPVWLLELA